MTQSFHCASLCASKNSLLQHIHKYKPTTVNLMLTMPGQLSPLTGEEVKKYEMLMRKSVRNLREEAKRAKLCAGAKTKSELAYSMVKEKRPRRKISDTPEDPLPSPGSRCTDLDILDRGSRIPYFPLHGVASHPQQPFPPNFSPAQLLAGADTRANLSENGSLEDELTKLGSSYQAGKDGLKEDAKKVVAYVPRVKQVFSDSSEPHRDKLATADHRSQDHVSVSTHSHPYPSRNRTPLESIAPPRCPKRSRHEAEPRQGLYQSPLYDKHFASPSNTERDRVVEGQGGWPCPTQILEQSPSPCADYDTALPSSVIYRPSPAFSTQAQLSYDRSATLAPIQHCNATCGGKHALELVDSPHALPTELSEGDQTLPPIREALSFLSWSDHSEAMPPFTQSHFPRTEDRRRLLGPG